MKDTVKESVWDCPRPPQVEAFEGLIEIVQDGITVVISTRAQRVLETSHPPGYYMPSDILMDWFYPPRQKNILRV